MISIKRRGIQTHNTVSLVGMSSHVVMPTAES